jgi:hypothetical protein
MSLFEYPVDVIPGDRVPTKPKKRLEFQFRIEAARRIRDYLNSELEKSPPGDVVFNYSTIAANSGVRESLVAELLAPNGGGHNGITLKRS